MGPDTVLSEEEENALVQWMFHTAKAGFPATKEQLLDSVQLLLKDTKKKNPFANDRPGRHWFESFKKRHPEISMRTASNICGSRGEVTNVNIKNWFNEIKIFFECEGILDVLSNENRVFNVDETALFLCPKGDKVIVQKGQKSVYNFNQNDEKECLTVLLGGNAAGLLTPPMIIFAYERIPSSVAFSLPDSFCVGKSENGWMTSANFFEYIVNVFHPWAQSQNIEFPIILFVDGHKSHLTLPLSEFCTKNGIVLVALYPNATHLLQPMDVAIFKPLKSAWKKSVLEFKIQNNARKLRRDDFAPLLHKTLKSTLKPEMFKNGFRRCGLCPFDADLVDYSRILSKTLDASLDAVDKNSTEKESKRKVLSYVENKLADKLKLFRKCNSELWNGDVQDRSLYEFWKTLRSECIPGEVETVTEDEDNNKENKDWTDLDMLLQRNDIIDCAINESGHLIVMPSEINIDLPHCDKMLPDTTKDISGNELCDIDKTKDISNNELCDKDDVQEKESTIREIRLNNENQKKNSKNVDNVEVLENQVENQTCSAYNNTRTPKSNENIDASYTSIAQENSESITVSNENIVMSCDKDKKTKNITKSSTTPSKNIDTPEENNTPYKSSIVHSENIDVPSTSTAQINYADPNVPSPFKRILFWPSDENKEVKKRKREKIPSVATSKEWQEYYTKKETAKKQIEEEKLERKRKREERKKSLQTSQNSKSKTAENNSSDSDESTKSLPSLNTSNRDSPKNLKLYDYVIVKYNKNYYPGIVEEISDDEVFVSAMTCSKKNWKWPMPPDKVWYNINDNVLKIIKKPEPVGNRGLYVVPEMKNYK